MNNRSHLSFDEDKKGSIDHIPNNALELLEFIDNRQPGNPIIQIFQEKFLNVYSLLSSNPDTQELSDKVTELISDFNKYTSSTSKDFNSENKLFLMYACRDIMDDIKLLVQSAVDKQKTENAHTSFPALDVALSAFQLIKIYTPEESLVNKIDAFEQFIEHDVKFKVIENRLLKSYANNDSIKSQNQKNLLDVFMKTRE